MTRPHSPGWYQDPEAPNNVRWWDGTQWTPQSMPNPALSHRSSSASPDPQPASEAKADEGEGTKQNLAFIVGVPIAGLLVLGIVIFVVLSAALPDTVTFDGPSSTIASPTVERSAEESRKAAAEQSSAAEESRIAAERSSFLAAEEARKVDKSQYRQITERDWRLIVKNPDSHIDERVVLYGEVTQADRATGAKVIRVDTGGQPSGSYAVNTVAEEGLDGIFANVIQGDRVTVWARVLGTVTYTNRLDRELTVPKIEVFIIEVTGTGG